VLFKEAIALLKERHSTERLSINIIMRENRKIAVEATVGNLIAFLKSLDDTGEMTGWSIN
jgi:hypothetical protein